MIYSFYFTVDSSNIDHKQWWDLLFSSTSHLVDHYLELEHLTYSGWKRTTKTLILQLILNKKRSRSIKKWINWELISTKVEPWELTSTKSIFLGIVYFWKLRSTKVELWELTSTKGELWELTSTKSRGLGNKIYKSRSLGIKVYKSRYFGN